MFVELFSYPLEPADLIAPSSTLHLVSNVGSIFFGFSTISNLRIHWLTNIISSFHTTSLVCLPIVCALRWLERPMQFSQASFYGKICCFVPFKCTHNEILMEEKVDKKSPALDGIWTHNPFITRCANDHCPCRSFSIFKASRRKKWVLP